MILPSYYEQFTFDNDTDEEAIANINSDMSYLSDKLNDFNEARGQRGLDDLRLMEHMENMTKILKHTLSNVHRIVYRHSKQFKIKKITEDD